MSEVYVFVGETSNGCVSCAPSCDACTMSGNPQKIHNAKKANYCSEECT